MTLDCYRENLKILELRFKLLLVSDKMYIIEDGKQLDCQSDLSLDLQQQ